MAHHPTATYNRDDNLTHIPNQEAIRMFYRHWPAVLAKPKGVPRHPALAYTRPKNEPIPIPEADNLRLWALRRQAAREFTEAYRESGTIPARPALTEEQADDQELLARIEGWHDFAAAHPEIIGTLYVDYLSGEDRAEARILTGGEGPAVPPATKDDPVKVAQAAHASKEARVIVRRAGLPKELKELAVSRVVADLTDPPPQKIKLTRERIMTKFPSPSYTWEIKCGRTADQSLMKRLEGLLSWLKGMAFASFADDANATANHAGRLVKAFIPLLENRELAYPRLTRACRAADLELSPKVRSELDKLTAFALARAEAEGDRPPGQAWVYTVGRIADLRTTLDECALPETQSPYETEEYETLLGMDRRELNRIAVRAGTEYYPARRTKERTLLLPGEWIVKWSEGPEDDGETDIRARSDSGFGYLSWAEIIERASQRKTYTTPEDLYGLAQARSKGTAGDAVHLPDMTPANAQVYAGSFLKAAFIELEQRAETMPPELHQPALDSLTALCRDEARHEHYGTTRYRKVIQHTVNAYMASRLPGDWKLAVAEIAAALSTPPRPDYSVAGTPAQDALRQWRAAADALRKDEVERHQRLISAGRSGEADVGLVWENAMSGAYGPKHVKPSVNGIRSRKERKPAAVADVWQQRLLA